MEIGNGMQYIEHQRRYYSRNRNGILAVMVLTAVLFFVLGWFLVQFGRKITLKEIESELEGKIATASALMHQFLSGPMTVGRLMASEEKVLRALNEPGSTDAVAAANRLMDHYLEVARVSVTGIYTAEGRILATYSGGQTFLGRDLSFRPYIRNALKGIDFQYFALGHNEKRRGYYAATPVRDPDGGIIGVAMVKKELHEDIVGFDKTGYTFFVSPDGVVFLSGNPEFLYKSIAPIPENRIGDLQKSRQFGNQKLEPLGIQWKSDTGEAVWNNKTLLFKEKQVGPPGWRLIVMRDKSPVFRTQYLLAAIIFSIFLVVTLGIRAFMREKEAARFLAHSNIELEKRVRLRTAELKKSNSELQAQIDERKKAEQELKKGEAALKQSEEKYRVLFESFPLGVSITDKDGNIIEVNRLSERLLEFSAGEHTKKRLDSADWKVIGSDGERLGTEDLPGVRAQRENRLIEDAEMGFVRKNGETIWLNVTAAPIPLEDFGVAIAYNDITERKRAEDELVRYREQLEDLVEERTRDLNAAQEELIRREKLAVLGQLTATVSHELRNPLAVIRASAFYLQRKIPDAGDTVTKHLTRINEQVSISNGIVDDLLEYTRGQQTEKETGEINPWLQELLDEFKDLPEGEVVCELAPDLPLVSFDRDKMRRVVVNLVTNALQAVSAKKDQTAAASDNYRPQVRISARCGHDGVILLVEDNGIGMDAETQKRAFEPLFTTRARGTGLGLAIVEKIVAEHGGAVTLKSSRNEGSAVGFVLPIVEGPSSPAPIS
jgi:PAS domain S-box-containing protein